MIAHIVFFRPKAALSEADVRALARSLGEVAMEIGSIQRAYVGRSISIDPGYQRSFGDSTYSHAAVVEFEHREGLVEYLGHPRHQELGGLFWRACDATAILEVETRALDAADLGDFLVDRPEEK